MRTLQLYLPEDSGYDRAAQFARVVYERELNFRIKQFPDCLLALTDGSGAVSGCIGLNNVVSNSLFVRDNEIKSKIDARTKSGSRVVEQSVLALQYASIGLPLLISAVITLAAARDAEKLVFAGTEVVFRTLRNIGFVVEELGYANEGALADTERDNYATWFERNDPVVALIETGQAAVILDRLLRRFHHRVRVDGELVFMLSRLLIKQVVDSNKVIS